MHLTLDTVNEIIDDAVNELSISCIDSHDSELMKKVRKRIKHDIKEEEYKLLDEMADDMIKEENHENNK